MDGRTLRLLAFLAVLGLSVSGASEELTGHLQPFGYQRPASYPIDEYDDPFALHPGEFYELYIKARRPVVFRGASRHFLAFREWTKERLAEKYGKLELRIEPRRDGSSASNPIGALGIGRDTMENFLHRYERSNTYVVSELPKPMYSDIELLPCMSCGDFLHSVSEINLWMSGGGTRSRLHRDAFNAINCQINGTKDWIMIPPNQTDNIYFKAASEWELGGLSPINTDSVDLVKYPRAKDVPWGITTVEAGDCIYIPGGKEHELRWLVIMEWIFHVCKQKKHDTTALMMCSCVLVYVCSLPRALPPGAIVWFHKRGCVSTLFPSGDGLRAGV